ncbi:MAG: RNA polymerase subunit sigma, partial [Ruminiclostridium sp.]|nr:RNA polymerase subunit sigma [Ruminiclostridium sp.]
YYEGYRAEQIADILGISTNAVISRLSRARRQLKKLITDERNDDNGLQRTVR